MFGSLILLPLHLQDVVGPDTLASGLAPAGGLIVGVAAPSVGRWYDALSPACEEGSRPDGRLPSSHATGGQLKTMPPSTRID